MLIILAIFLALCLDVLLMAFDEHRAEYAREIVASCMVLCLLAVAIGVIA